MDYMIAVRNAKTGAEKSFYDKQQVADFLASPAGGKDWEGYAHLGDLPAPTVEAEPAAEVEEAPEVPAVVKVAAKVEAKPEAKTHTAPIKHTRKK